MASFEVDQVAVVVGEVLEAVVVAAVGHCFVVAAVLVFPVQATLLREAVVPGKTGRFCSLVCVFR